jgi:predicted transcriptional regulator
MTDDIAQIQFIRRSLGLSQKELAEASSVSQSLIAKIESARIDPAYSKVMKIINVLNSLNKKKELKAGEIMTTRLVCAEKDDSIKKTIKKMKDYNISQLPVMDGKKPIGRITEADILNAITKSVSPDTHIEEIMDDESPIVSKDTSVSLVSTLLKNYNFILVSEKGKIIGVITKTDIITKAFR